METDGTEDSLVHCLKPGGVAADAAAGISAETATLIAGNADDSMDDPFASDDETEEDETVVDDD